jgi:WD repeat-containing protein 70
VLITAIVWDLRSFKKPLATRSGLTTLYPGTNAVFSPDDKYVISGAGASTKGGRGRLMFLEKAGLEVSKELEVDSTPVKVLWHSKINQVRGIAKCFDSVFNFVRS